MELFQIAAMAFCGIALVSLVKAYIPEISLYVSLAVGLILLLLILAQLQDVFVFFEEFDESFSYGSSYFPILWKVLAIAYISDLVAQVCKDAGEESIGNKVELAGKVIIFCLAIPLMQDLLNLLSLLIPE